MANNKLPKAQTGTSVPPSNRPTLDESFMQERYGGYRPNRVPTTPSTYKSSLPFTEIYQPKQDGGKSPIEELNAKLAAIPKTTGGPKLRTLDQYKGAGRYSYFNPDPQWDNEDAAAQGQGWGSKMVNGVGKGLALTGTTFLQNTVGLVNGTINAIGDGRFASFYDNEFNRALDELNKTLEDQLPNYYTREERDAAWRS